MAHLMLRIGLIAPDWVTDSHSYCWQPVSCPIGSLHISKAISGSRSDRFTDDVMAKRFAGSLLLILTLFLLIGFSQPGTSETHSGIATPALTDAIEAGATHDSRTLGAAQTRP